MIDVSRLLPTLVRANPELAAKLAWSRAAGEGLRRNAVPVRLEGRTLTVSVADGLWQRQLESMAGELLFRLNNLMGGGGVERIVFRIAPSDLPKSEPAQADKTPSQKATNVTPTELLFAAGTITDADLRAKFLRAAGNLIARRDSRSKT